LSAGFFCVRHSFNKFSPGLLSIRHKGVIS
jgi:hypothetical protein